MAPFEVYESGLRGAVDGFVLTCARELTGFIKPKKVTEHDSYHLLLVRKLREDKPSDTLGPLFWFLTFDASLLCVDKGINQILETEYELPSSIECWAWVELISPYFGPKISNEAGFESFSDLMKTQFSLLPARIDTRKLVTVQTREINYDLFTPEQIRAILNDEFVKEYWSKFQEAKLTRSPIVKKYQKEMQERVEVVAEKILTKRTQTEIITRYISAGMSLLTIAFALYCTYTEKYIGTVILGILAVTFIAIAVGYSRLELIFEKACAKLSLKK